jgi:hypothetical protein
VPEHSTGPPVEDVLVLVLAVLVDAAVLEVVLALVEPPVPPWEPAIPVATFPPQAAMPNQVTPSAAAHGQERRATRERAFMG